MTHTAPGSPPPPRIGLVIQGPLESRGKGGSIFRVQKRNDVTADDLLTHNCVPDINTIVSKFGDRFQAIVVATWKGQDISGLEGVEVLELDDVTPAAREPRYGSQIGLQINKFRGYYSAWKGVEYLSKSTDLDIIIRMRTDQLFDLALFCEFLEQQRQSDPEFRERIYLPMVFRDRICELSDFFFAGQAETVHALYQSLVDHEFSECHTSVHVDIPLKYALICRRSHNLPELAYFPLRSAVPNMPASTRRVFADLYRNVLVPVPVSIIHSMSWRGEKMAREGFRKEITWSYDDWSNAGARDEILRRLDGADSRPGPPLWLGSNIGYMLANRNAAGSGKQASTWLLDAADWCSRAAGILGRQIARARKATKV